MLQHRIPLFFVSLLTAVGAVACGSSADDGEGDTPGDKSPTEVPAVKTGCGLSTKFEGDDQCLPVPAAEEGLQLHMGPSDYDDPDVINAKDENGKYLWLMEPGDERTQNYHVYTPNEEGIYYFVQHYRMRPGSHHMILSTSDDKEGPEGWTNKFSNIIGAIGGTQHITEDLPPGGVVPEEDADLGRGMEPHTALDAQLHFYNTTDEIRLREAWVNFMYKPKDEVKFNLGMLGGFTAMNVPPGTSKTVGNVCKAENFIPQGGDTTGDFRIVTLFGHAHVHNKRFVVYKENQDGSNSNVVYDSYAGAEAPTYTYNTIVDNPEPDQDALRSGATSGLLTITAGEQLRFECDIVNDTTSTFYGRNEVNNDEMCNLFGSVKGLGFPCFNLNRTTTPPPAMP